MKFENGNIYNLGFDEDIIDVVCASLIDEQAAGVSFDDIAVVFPGKRPGVYLRKKLSGDIKKSFFPPAIYSLEEFMREHYLRVNPDWAEVSMLDCAGMMYEILKDAGLKAFSAQEKLGFDAFLLWARKLAEVIEHADKECVPPEVFLNIELNAGIGYEVPAYVNEILSNLSTIRTRFHERLIEKKLFTMGFLHKLFIDDIDRYIEESGKDKIYLAGFYALNNSEKLLFKHMLDKGKASVIWQRDKNDPSDKVFSELESFFGRGAVENFGEGKVTDNIKIYEAFDTHSEIKQLRSILADAKDLDDTCIVLAQEGMLIPLLFQVSDMLDSGYNVSLGYQLRYTALYTLVEALFNAQQTRNRSGQYYARDYLRLLMHPFIKNIGHRRDSAQCTRIMVHKIEESLFGMVESELERKSFVGLDEIEGDEYVFAETLRLTERMNVDISEDELREELKNIHDMFFRPFESFSDMDGFLASLDKALRFLLKESLVSSYVFSPIVFDRLFEIIDQMRSSFYIEHIQVDTVSAFDLFRFYLYFEKIPFHGSPLKGTQILGLLETRSLNFKNVIILDVNEDVLPKGKDTDSLLPMGVASQLGLNTFNNMESVFRYHFFRLVRSAENVHLLYRNSPSQRVYRSRFLEELLWAAEKDSGKVFTDKDENALILKPKVSLAINKSDFLMEKSPQTIENIENMVFSSSSIDLYMHCPARFYFQYILRLREKEDIDDDIEARQIGNFLHELLKDFYAPFKNKRFSVNTDMKTVLFSKMEEKFKVFFNADSSQAKFLLEIIRFKLASFLEYESGIVGEREILYLEEEFSFDGNGGDKLYIDTKYGKAPLKGIFDRVEARYSQEGRKIVIIDYKTGKVPDIKNKLPEVFAGREEISEYVGSVQMPLYLYLFRCMDSSLGWGDMEGQFYALKNMSARKKEVSSLFPDKKGFSPDIFMDVHMMPAIKLLLEEIKDPSTPFCRDDSDARYCSHCPYSVMCKK